MTVLYDRAEALADQLRSASLATAQLADARDHDQQAVCAAAEQVPQCSYVPRDDSPPGPESGTRSELGRWLRERRPG